MPSHCTSNQPKPIAIIAASIGWGSGFHSAERGPSLLFEAGLADRLQANVIDIQAEPSMADGPLDQCATEQAIMKHASRVSDAVFQAIQEGVFPVVIGGDHTSALGFHAGPCEGTWPNRNHMGRHASRFKHARNKSIGKYSWNGAGWITRSWFSGDGKNHRVLSNAR